MPIVIPQEIIERLENEIPYTGRSDREICNELASYLTPLASIKVTGGPGDRRKKIILEIRRHIERIRRKTVVLGRCPECGAKLSSAACLACDLKKGKVKEDPFLF